MPGWHYETSQEAQAYKKKKKGMSKEAFRKHENEEAKKFRDNPANAHKAKPKGKVRRRILGGSGGTR